MVETLHPPEFTPSDIQLDHVYTTAESIANSEAIMKRFFSKAPEGFRETKRFGLNRLIDSPFARLTIFIPEDSDEQIEFFPESEAVNIVIDLSYSGFHRYYGLIKDEVEDKENVRIVELYGYGHDRKSINEANFSHLETALDFVHSKIRKPHPIHYSMSERTIPRSDQLRS